MNCTIEKEGAIIRMDSARKQIYMVFTAHEFNDGFGTILQVTKKYRIHVSFFLTGDFYRNPLNRYIINEIIIQGHYLGPHSDKHLLYCSWARRDSLLVTRDKFLADLSNNYKAMKYFGIKKKQASFFLPPYEWYNRKIYEWSKDEGLTLVNFTPGTSSNQDWTYPELGKSYLSSDIIYNRILRYEERYGMNGFILLIHPGTDPRRTDKLYNRLEDLVKYLRSCGYIFKRIDE